MFWQAPLRCTAFDAGGGVAILAPFEVGMSNEDDWRKLAAKELRSRRVETLTWQTPEGFAVKPLYTAADLEGIEADTLPGSAAFHARRARHHVCRPALDHPAICGLLDRGRVQRLLSQESGGRADGPVGCLRSATHRGYDSDHPRVTGDVGKAGVAIDSVEDMKILFAGIPLDKMSVSMTMNGAVIPVHGELHRRGGRAGRAA